MENELPNPGRIPKEGDLIALCRALNECGARYLIIGGFAVIHHGYVRATEDIDLLLDGDLDTIGCSYPGRLRNRQSLTSNASWTCAISLPSNRCGRSH
jgi:hypothetical protein